eukprot:Seg1640.5 transcript_id=Seg1640.5/GoldUCD/mRNA.D3Y31 product="Cytochrome c oxidase subunit 4 isoform 2 mitochondrial" protein_id=Seg1640.5/GoldUCD/D3Y31
MKTRIFATPSEPHFNLEAFAMTPDLLADSLHILAEENDAAIDAENGKIGHFKDGAPVVYQAQFPETFKETLAGPNDTKQVLGGIAIGLAVAFTAFAFLKKYVGPEPPKTINEEWRAASLEKRKLYRQNPISGE